MGGFLGGLFGGSPSLNTGPASTYMSTLNGIGNGLASQANQSGQQLGTFNANDLSALNAYSNYLTSNPATQQYNAQQTANAEQGASEGAQKATAGFEQSLAERGISPNSSVGVGGLASIDEGLAANNANVQAQVGEQNQQQHAANLGQNAALWSGAQGTAFGQNAQTTGQEANLYSGLVSDADQMAMQQYQQQVAQQNGQLGFLGQLGSTAATTLAPWLKTQGI
jgi:hypothetical protein